jgi:hypothetical protein
LAAIANLRYTIFGCGRQPRWEIRGVFAILF